MAFWKAFDFFVLAILIICDILLVVFAKTRDAWFWKFYFAYCLLTIIPGWPVISAYIKEIRYWVCYRRVIAESKERLRSKDYHDHLLQASGNDCALAEALEMYIRQNDFVLQDGQYVPRQQ